ncbi:hypothetical protein LUZ60_009511 [Juncus effusus]|nr:hypothetical protein LUZ60_009511 [Juncus effusus]
MKKIVVKVNIVCDKCKTGILKTVAKLSGIKSMEIDEEKHTLTVIGNVDPASIVNALRKKKKQASIDSVGPEKAEEKKKDPGKDLCKDLCKDLPACCRYCRPMLPYSNIVWYEQPSGCTIV